MHLGETLSEFDVRKIYCSKIVPVVSKTYSAWAKEPIPFQALAELPLIFVQSGYSIRDYYTKRYQAHNMEFAPRIETPTMDIQIKAVKLGLGYSFVPYPHIKDDLANGELFMLNIIDENVLERSICLITMKDAPLSRAAQALVDILKEAANDYSNF